MIQSPGIQVTEYDRAAYNAGIQGSYIFVMGYADKGIPLTPYEITSFDDFKTNYGAPTNEAERYFFYAGQEVINQGGSLIAASLPYNNVISNAYRCMGINAESTPAAYNSVSLSAYTELAALSSFSQLSGGVIKLTPSTVATTGLTIHRDVYDIIKAGGDFTTADAASVLYDNIASYEYLIVNENKAQFTGANAHEGIFTVLVDPIDAMRVQRLITNSDSDVFSIMKGINYPSGINYQLGTGSASGIMISDFDVNLTGTYIGSSFSEDLARQFPGINWTEGGTKFDPYYFHQLGVIVCQTVEDTNNDGRLSLNIIEAFVGSVHPGKRDPATGQSIYLGDLINNTSNYIRWYADPDFVNTSVQYPLSAYENDENSVLFVPDMEYDMLNFSALESKKWIAGGTSLVNDMKTVMQKVSNIDAVQIDVVLDAGLSTISEYTNDNGSTGEIYDPITDSDDYGACNSPTRVEQWRNVCSELIAFCSQTRKDCMCVLDIPRFIVLDKNSKWVRETAPTNSFSNTIGNKLRYVTGLNSNYAALYADWMKIIDNYSGVAFWAPPSVKVGGIYVYNDRVGNIWDAPAGLNRGIINGIVDLAFNPNTKEADQLYIKSINYARRYPLDGFILEGQKTTQTKPSAFDRVNVRRLFLRLERLAYQVARYYVYEPNTSYTRRSLVDTLTPTFRTIQAAGGIYSYSIISDNSNNTSDVIDRNELKVAILIAPTKTAEFILLDFVAVRTGTTNFQEIVQTLGV